MSLCRKIKIHKSQLLITISQISAMTVASHLLRVLIRIEIHLRVIHWSNNLRQNQPHVPAISQQVPTEADDVDRETMSEDEGFFQPLTFDDHKT